MSLLPPNAIDIAHALIVCPSVTPAEAGALGVLQSLLEPAGFTCERLTFSAAGSPDVDNLFARFGTGEPHLCFAGHTDVVPPGDPAAWTHPPFGAVIADGQLFGRGAVDMKGAIACFTAAAVAFLGDRSPAWQGSISLLITGDEEGPALNGTVKVLDWMARHGHCPSHCVVGEPSNVRDLGDTIKIGRRGSVSAKLRVRGKQGHAAYPQLANNPLRGLIKICAALQVLELDQGTSDFAPSHLEIVAIETGNPAYNIIPAAAEARLNVRFNDRHTAASLEAMIRQQSMMALEGSGLVLEAEFVSNAEAFVTAPGPLVDVLRAAILVQTGHRDVQLSTSGGTSDARFIKNYCPVVEFGLVNKTIHAVDERVPLADLTALTGIYRRFLDGYFAASP